jgi:hypothetical protein
MSEINPRLWNRTEVRCLAGYRANERPISFLKAGRDMEIRSILDSWGEPEYLYFKVETKDGGVYELRHHEFEDLWETRESARLS